MAAPQSTSGSNRRSSSTNDYFVGRYRRLESIGKGSFAVVYKGVHPVSPLALTPPRLLPLKLPMTDILAFSLMLLNPSFES